MPRTGTPQQPQSQQQQGHDDIIVHALRRDGIPVTRDNYIKKNWRPIPQPWTAEHEYMLPDFLQDWSRFGRQT